MGRTSTNCHRVSSGKRTARSYYLAGDPIVLVRVRTGIQEMSFHTDTAYAQEEHYGNDV